MNTMTEAKTGDQIIANFTVRTNEGVLVGEGPQKLTLGAKEAFAGIESAIIGMSVGEEKSVTIVSSDAFGPRRDELVIRIPRDQLPQDIRPEKGAKLVSKNENGDEIRLTILETDDDSIVADGNHPLAGEDLNIRLSLLKIVSPGAV